MRTSILSILIALTVVVAGPLVFAAQDEVSEKEAATKEAVVETVDVQEVAESEPREDCSNNADNDGDSRIDCKDTDCVEDPACKGGY